MRVIVFLLAFVIIAGCASGGGKPMARPSHTAAPDAYANGRAIFTTGLDLQGHRIVASPTALRSSCIQCHRGDGSGGMHFPGGVVSADLRHKALTSEPQHPYTIALLERAISAGVDNDGDKLDRVMPRWRMSRRDLHDVAVYVYYKLR